MNCENCKHTIIIFSVLNVKKSDNKGYISQLTDITQKWVCAWNNHINLNFQMN